MNITSSTVVIVVELALVTSCGELDHRNLRNTHLIPYEFHA